MERSSYVVVEGTIYQLLKKNPTPWCSERGKVLKSYFAQKLPMFTNCFTVFLPYFVLSGTCP
jgi:hypothetical protein